MQKRFILLTGFLMIFLFAGDILAYLGAQEEEIDKNMPENKNFEQDENPLVEHKVQTFSGIIYALSRKKGFLVSFDHGNTWIERNKGLPQKIVYPFTNTPMRILTTLYVDPKHEGRIAVTTSDKLFFSEDYGYSWKEIPLGKPLRNSSYLTSVAILPDNPDTLIVGTSFNGFFETHDRGKSWQDPSLKIPFLYRGAGFYEEISGLAYHPLKEGVVIFSCGFGHGIYISSPDRSSWTRFDFPGDTHNELVCRLQVKKTETDWLLEVKTGQSLWHYSFLKGSWKLIENDSSLLQDDDPFRKERIRKASGKLGIYVSSYHASGEKLENHLNFLTQHGLNSIVVDVKDDFGWITYNTELEFPKKIGAVKQRFNLETLLKKAKERGIYVIARLVVFKDKRLYNYSNYKYAVWNKNTDKPWRYLLKIEEEKKYVQNEYWVDPFNPFVWEYNLMIANELQKKGVDEIQFDYIRFPSDGPLSEIQYRFRKEKMSRIDALESFLIMVRSSIHIPISTDLYGFNSWHRMGNWIGQSIDMLADYVDVVCPMFYPSHFPGDFINDRTYLVRAQQIYEEGTTRAESIVGKRSIIRPYIQAFLIGNELRMSASEYSDYLKRQITGTLNAPSSGFTLWNASNRYYMVRESLKSFITAERSQ